jgi:hypothetical protein
MLRDLDSLRINNKWLAPVLITLYVIAVLMFSGLSKAGNTDAVTAVDGKNSGVIPASHR